jgi:glycosyltransferase involved in cell wall biosynthesis
MVVGQIPPPFGGQTIMTQALLDGEYQNAELLHVDAAFSTALSDMGHSSIIKAGRLIRVLARSLVCRVRARPSVLYYHPAGSSRSAILRDLVLLTVLRPLFSGVVFHVHARGLIEACALLPAPLRLLARRAYGTPDVVVGPSRAIVDEALPLHAAQNRVIANGTLGGRPKKSHDAEDVIDILFLNLISEAKGAMWLLGSVAELHREGIAVRLTMVGEFESPHFREKFDARARKLGVDDRVVLAGTAIGVDKWHCMEEADIFCLPTTWPQESFGLALIEAASCSLPVLAADVPGVREVFEPGASIMLADPGDPGTLTQHLRDLCRDPLLRKRLGNAARDAFEERYTLARYWSDIDELFATMKKEAT